MAHRLFVGLYGIYARVELALQLEGLIEARAKEKQLSTLKQNTVYPNLNKRQKPIDTQKELAKLAGAHSYIMYKYQDESIRYTHNETSTGNHRDKIRY